MTETNFKEFLGKRIKPSAVTVFIILLLFFISDFVGLPEPSLHNILVLLLHDFLLPFPIIMGISVLIIFIEWKVKTRKNRDR
ncbi:MAG: hypothetical protein ACLFR1_01185 [Spirochaetia bacterium]